MSRIDVWRLRLAAVEDLLFASPDYALRHAVQNLKALPL